MTYTAHAHTHTHTHTHTQYITHISFKPQMTYLPQPTKLSKCWYCKHCRTNITTAPHCSVTYRSIFRWNTEFCFRITAEDTTVILEIFTTGNATQLNNDFTTHQKEENCLLLCLQPICSCHRTAVRGHGIAVADRWGMICTVKCCRCHDYDVQIWSHNNHIFYHLLQKKRKVILGRIQNKMKIMHVSNCVVLVGGKKTLQRHVVILYHHLNIRKQ